ncbi:MAG: hypothetical protein RL380_473 [Verrucomicrobiota bacterium]
MIHPTAIISPGARLHPSVTVAPYAVIDAGVSLGAGCVVGPHVYLTGETTIDERNVFHAGCVIGDAPQDLKYKNELTRVRIGNDNVFREHVTVHRSNQLAEDTVIGAHNLLMANSHVGHNSHVGDHVILANGALLGGHVTVGDRAFISGNCCVHQFCRVGTLALMQGSAAISQDLAPFTMVQHVNEACGLNIVGLRRAGINAAERLELKQLYKKIFRSGENFRAAVAAAQNEFTSAPAKTMLEFLATTKRGVCADPGGAAESDEA